MNGPVYSKYDNISDVQYKSMSTDETETNIEDSVIYDGDRDLEEVKYDTHNKNANKGEGCVEVEVNSNGEENRRLPGVASSNFLEGS